MRADILSPPVIKGYSSHSGLAGPHCQLRGMAPKAAKFVYDFWTHPETLAAVSAAAGEDLVPVFNYELGHVNVGLSSQHTGWKAQLLTSTAAAATDPSEEG